MVRMSRHAREQLASRAVVTEEEVIDACTKVEGQIASSRDWQAVVVVKTLEQKVSFPDGSNGDMVVACVDPDSRVVKTVMLRRQEQRHQQRHAENGQHAQRQREVGTQNLDRGHEKDRRRSGKKPALRLQPGHTPAQPGQRTRTSGRGRRGEAVHGVLRKGGIGESDVHVRLPPP